MIASIILFKRSFFLFSFNCIAADIAIIMNFRKLIEQEVSMPYALFSALCNRGFRIMCPLYAEILLT